MGDKQKEGAGRGSRMGSFEDSATIDVQITGKGSDTPLAIAIKLVKRELFSMLLTNGHTHICVTRDNSPLELAIKLLRESMYVLSCFQGAKQGWWRRRICSRLGISRCRSRCSSLKLQAGVGRGSLGGGFPCNCNEMQFPTVLQ